MGLRSSLFDNPQHKNWILSLIGSYVNINTCIIKTGIRQEFQSNLSTCYKLSNISSDFIYSYPFHFQEIFQILLETDFLCLSSDICYWISLASSYSQPDPKVNGLCLHGWIIGWGKDTDTF